MIKQCISAEQTGWLSLRQPLGPKIKYLVTTGLLVVAALVQAGDRTIDIEKDNKEMNEAIAKAQATLDEFLMAVDKPQASATAFTVKIRVAHRNGAEHLWMLPFRRDKSTFIGIVANEPEHLPDVHLGEELSFRRSDITDWGYEVDGKKKGFFTVCVMFKHMSHDEARQYQQDGYQC
jgi:uncharacterized protein YegJ (DUF2314 family)